MKVVEFAGMPKSGKTTHLEILETVLKHEHRKKLRVIYEGARISPLDKSDRFHYNAWSFHNTLNRLMEARLDEFDFILIDRGVYDHIAFNKALYKNGSITESQYMANIGYFEEFSGLQNAVIAFNITPEEAAKRETKYHNIAGRVMNLDFLRLLHEAYQETFKELPGEHLLIDSSSTIEVNKRDILSFIERRKVA